MSAGEAALAAGFIAAPEVALAYEGVKHAPAIAMGGLIIMCIGLILVGAVVRTFSKTIGNIMIVIGALVAIKSYYFGMASERKKGNI